MAKINSYPFDSTIQDADAWIGTDSTNRSTKQYTAEAVAAYTIGGLISGGTINTLPIFTSTGLADSLISQDNIGIVYIGTQASGTRFTNTSISTPNLLGTDLYVANIYGQNGGLLNIQGNAIIGNEATDTLTVNSVSTFNAAVADGTGSVGTAGQVLSSTVTGTAWINNVAPAYTSSFIKVFQSGTGEPTLTFISNAAGLVLGTDTRVGTGQYYFTFTGSPPDKDDVMIVLPGGLKNGQYGFITLVSEYRNSGQLFINSYGVNGSGALIPTEIGFGGSNSFIAEIKVFS